MGALAFWKAVVADESNFLEGIVKLLAERGIRYCAIGGVGVNAYAEALLTQDLDIVVATDQMEEVRRFLGERYRVTEFPHSVNVQDPHSGLQVQLQRDSRYAPFVVRATVREVLGLKLPVAAAADVLQGKVWAVSDPHRRASKRGKDILDIGRLIDAFPELSSNVPPKILERLRGLTDELSAE
jgi:hypothetical protein